MKVVTGKIGWTGANQRNQRWKEGAINVWETTTKGLVQNYGGEVNIVCPSKNEVPQLEQSD